MAYPGDHILGYVEELHSHFTLVLSLTTNSASRGFIIHAWGKEKVTPREKIPASAIAGGVGGTAGGLLRQYFVPY
jgi:hypothetical protein